MWSRKDVRCSRIYKKETKALRESLFLFLPTVMHGPVPAAGKGCARHDVAGGTVTCNGGSLNVLSISCGDVSGNVGDLDLFTWRAVRA